MMKLQSRNGFPLLLRELKLTGEAAEIGVAEGYFSHFLLDNWPGKVHQIDPWRILDTPGFSGHGEATNAEQDARYHRMLHASMRYKGRCIVKRMTSEQAVLEFKDGQLDFVYIDAIHTYEAAKEDIKLWYPKVKSGGVLAGHDYLDGVFHGQDYGVKRAVTEFASRNKLRVGETKEPDWPSWWVMKP